MKYCGNTEIEIRQKCCHQRRIGPLRFYPLFYFSVIQNIYYYTDISLDIKTHMWTLSDLLAEDQTKFLHQTDNLNGELSDTAEVQIKFGQM